MAVGIGEFGTVELSHFAFTHAIREHGEPAKSEFTVVKVEAYEGINAYLSELASTDVHTLQDVVDYNRKNRGTEGAFPGDHPAFPSGQVH